MTGQHESVVVVIPFAGSAEELEATARSWASVVDGEDRLVGIVLVQNAADAQARQVGRVSVIPASDHGSSYYARNVGAASQESDWILFVDADCIPDPEILDEYFATPREDRVGAVVGGIRPGHGSSLVARYSASRAILDPDHAGSLDEGASAVTANLLVRRTAFDECGGFCEGIRSGGDIDFSWRLQERGWEISSQRSASVRHVHRETVRDLRRQYRRYGAGYGWLRRRYAALGSSRFDGTRPTLGGIRAALVSMVGAIRALLRRDRDEVVYATLDGVAALSWMRGTWDDNRPRWSSTASVAPHPGVNAGAIIEVDGVAESRGRPREPHANELRGKALRYWEDDGYAERFRALALVAARLIVAGRFNVLAAVARFGRDRELAPAARRVETAQHARLLDREADAAAVLARASGRLTDPRDSAS